MRLELCLLVSGCRSKTGREWPCPATLETCCSWRASACGATWWETWEPHHLPPGNSPPLEYFFPPVFDDDRTLEHTVSLRSIRNNNRRLDDPKIVINSASSTSISCQQERRPVSELFDFLSAVLPTLLHCYPLSWISSSLRCFEQSHFGYKNTSNGLTSDKRKWRLILLTGQIFIGFSYAILLAGN